ncbi:unknown [Fusobacterium sp. CAG:439]|nr:unknown [Fusobacterium sp. CAG:439]
MEEPLLALLPIAILLLPKLCASRPIAIVSEKPDLAHKPSAIAPSESSVSIDASSPIAIAPVALKTFISTPEPTAIVLPE